MKRVTAYLWLLPFLVAPALVLSGCDASSLSESAEVSVRPNAPVTDAAPNTAKPLGAQLGAVRALTARYQRVGVGEDAGWAAPVPYHCVERPGVGGMGYHYINGAYLLDGGKVDVLEPEALLYEPQQNGRLRLVGVEYVVLYSDVPATGPPPELFGEEFHPNPALGLWMLHVWIWKNNPDGMFADFNPTVSCEHAVEE